MEPSEWKLIGTAIGYPSRRLDRFSGVNPLHLFCRLQVVLGVTTGSSTAVENNYPAHAVEDIMQNRIVRLDIMDVVGGCGFDTKSSAEFEQSGIAPRVVVEKMV